ncbi:MAG TPA: TatD family hydrolase [Saprospiraceae bacterium]|nr:TatD family hydrolase [Saprospiraceae bacterium]
MWIDSHAHLYADVFDEDREEMLKCAMEAGLEAVVLPNIDLDSIDKMFELTAKHSGLLYPAVGLHPCSVGEQYEEQLKRLETYLDREEVVAIGETGLDYYWDKTTVNLQKEALRIQIEWALDMNLPIILHARESLDDLIDLISEYQETALRGVFHCFTGTVEQGKRIAELDFYVGIGGILTFKNSGLDQVVGELPLDRIVLETDAPYLCPTPHRGKRNESAYTALVGKKLAEILGIDVNTMAQQTSENAQRLFGI